MQQNKQFFTSQLLTWHHNDNTRQLPWKQERDPYKIWLSEVILQQTRADQGLKYYLNFTETFPAICDLAQASDELVFRMWQGLGYYNRCRNMLATARQICDQFGGVFPHQYEEILALKGVGTYTAAAIASFAFDLPYAVLDGNVYRVLSRYFGIEEAIDSSLGKKLFASLAQELLAKDAPALYNQAIMDLGATVCTPKQAKCADCPLQQRCLGYKQEMVHLLPVKEKKIKVKTRFFNFLVLQHGQQVWITQRNTTDVWQHLHQFYLIEADRLLSLDELKERALLRNHSDFVQCISYETCIKQRLTHQIIESAFWRVEFAQPIPIDKIGFWVDTKDLGLYAFPKTLVDYVQAYFYE